MSFRQSADEWNRLVLQRLNRGARGESPILFILFRCNAGPHPAGVCVRLRTACTNLNRRECVVSLIQFIYLNELFFIILFTFIFCSRISACAAPDARAQSPKMGTGQCGFPQTSPRNARDFMLVHPMNICYRGKPTANLMREAA
jgi:hypothetical protein